MDLDTNWCPVCDRLIPPERITLPTPPEVETIKAASDAAPKPKLAATRPPISRRHTANHTRSNSKSTALASKATGLELLNTHVSNSTTAPKPRTVISQAPSALYCSESCRERDQTLSERFQLSLETMFSNGPSSASSLSSPLLVSGSESDVDVDVLTNESYFAQLRIHGRSRHQGSALNLEKTSWSTSQLSANSARTTSSSSEDLPAVSTTTKQPPPPATTTSHRRPLSYSHTSSSTSTHDVNVSLYAAYPLTFHRTRSGEGSARSRKNSYASLHGTSLGAHHSQESSPIPLENPSKSKDVTPTQSLYGIDMISAQGLLVRPAMLRSKTDRTGLTPLSPISPVPDSAPRLYAPHYPSSLPPSKFGFTPMSTPASPTGSRSSSRKPTKGDPLRPRRRSDNISEELLTEASRVKSCDQLAGQKTPFLPMYPALMPAPCTRVVQKLVLERGEDGVERMVQKEVVEEYYEERKRLFHFNAEVK
ncbi:Ecl1 domain protein [Ceratobasidium sp. AG-Ba]|nr:Ecl1 domain protein [Ceratobasidium sp. AG-Ba]